MHATRTARLMTSLPLIVALAACGGGDDPADAASGSGGATGASTGEPSGTGTSNATSGSGASSGAGAGTGTGTGSGGGLPDFEGMSRVDTGSGAAVLGSADVAIAPNGTIYVSWADEQDGARDVFVARSVDGGATFGAAVRVDDAGTEPLISMARHPYVAADDERVAVVFNDEGGAVRLYLSAAVDALAFDAPVAIGGDVATAFRDFPKPLFLDDGDVVVAWQGYPDSGARIFLSRESAGFASEEASGGAPGVPCECCPLDLVQTTGGDLMVAFRNNDGDTREMWLATAPDASAFSSFVPLSTSEGTLFTCPMQGPRLAQTSDSNRLAVWSARGSESTGAVHLSTSVDGGASWSGGAPIPGFMGDEPTIAVAGSGRVYVTAVTGNGSSSMVWRDGDVWSAPEPLIAPDGELGVPQAEHGGGAAALAAVSSAGTVWLRRME
jgi:hypothetical protein